MSANYKVTLTNFKNENLEVYVPGCEDQKEAWSRAQDAERKYNPLNKALVTKIEICNSYEDFLKSN